MKKYVVILLFYNLLVNCSQRSLRQQNNSTIVKIAIMGTNDLHGTAFPKQLYRKDNHEQYKYGGLVYMAKLINIVRAQYGDHSIYLDTGDQYQGGVQAGPEVSKGQIIADFFNQLDLKASVLGNHEFDFGQQFLFNYLNSKNSPNLGANLFSQDGDPNFLPKHKSSQIFNLNGVKLGVIGLSTIETPTTTSGFISRKFPKYQFHNYPQITIKQSKKLRQQGAQIILVLAHFGNKCPWNKTYDIRTNQTIQEPCQNDQVLTFIDSLPQGTVDGVLCGHRHQFAHHWHKNVPFMGAIDGGYYFNIMYFYFDLQVRKIVKTQIQGPIPVCQRIFQNSKTCEFHTSQQLITAGPLTSWMFHNQTVTADEKIQQIFNQKYVPLMQRLTKKLVQNQLLLDRVKDQENEIANLITTLMIRAAQSKNITAHFSMINHGSFRSTWFPGEIQHQHFYNMFPFQNNMVTFEIQGKYLKQMLKRIQNGWDGFYFLDGIHQFVSLTKIIDEDDFYYKKGFLNATLLNGEQIEDQLYYIGVTLQFLLQGGDDFVKAFGQYINPQTKTYFQKLPIHNITKIGQQRQLLYQQLSLLQVIRQQQWKVNHTKQSRLIVVKN